MMQSRDSSTLECQNRLVCVSRSVVSESLQPQALEPARLLCPWHSPGKNTRVVNHSLLQGIFPNQGSNLGLLHCRLEGLLKQTAESTFRVSYSGGLGRDLKICILNMFQGDTF